MDAAARFNVDLFSIFIAECVEPLLRWTVAIISSSSRREIQIVINVLLIAIVAGCTLRLCWTVLESVASVGLIVTNLGACNKFQGNVAVTDDTHTFHCPHLILLSSCMFINSQHKYLDHSPWRSSSFVIKAFNFFIPTEVHIEDCHSRKGTIRCHYDYHIKAQGGWYWWAGHVVSMGERRYADRILVGNPEREESCRKTSHRWEENIKMVGEIGWEHVNWIRLV